MVRMSFLVLIVGTLLSCSSAKKKELEAAKNAATKAPPPSSPNAPAVAPVRLIAKAEILLDQKYFKVSYNEDHRLANWVSYRLSAQNLRAPAPAPRGRYVADMTLMKMRLPYAKPQDMESKEYDRVPLAPFQDFAWNPEALESSYVMSSIVPLKAALNRGAWKPLEKKIRGWACQEQELVIINGPIIDRRLTKFPSKVSVPKRFFKIVIDTTEPKKAIAFLFSQNDTQFSMEKHAVSLADVERANGTLFGNETGFTRAEYLKLRQSFNPEDWVESRCR